MASDCSRCTACPSAAPSVRPLPAAHPSAVPPARPLAAAQVDCSLADVEAARPRLLRLLAPADTVMDLNIGAALWLAARGAGALLPAQIESPAAGQGAQPCSAAPVAAAAAPAPVQQDQQRPDQQLGGLHLAAACCRSKARVVLLGHGADELFGGYGRHRTAFRARGWQGLGDELALDLRRLWLRNLGRDDRLVADHGRWAPGWQRAEGARTDWIVCGVGEGWVGGVGGRGETRRRLLPMLGSGCQDEQVLGIHLSRANRGHA